MPYGVGQFSEDRMFSELLLNSSENMVNPLGQWRGELGGQGWLLFLLCKSQQAPEISPQPQA